MSGELIFLMLLVISVICIHVAYLIGFDKGMDKQREEIDKLVYSKEISETTMQIKDLMKKIVEAQYDKDNFPYMDSERRVSVGLLKEAQFALNYAFKELRAYEKAAELRIESNVRSLKQLQTLKADNEALRKKLELKQAEIDRLMLEYCPKEMSDEQLWKYEKSQKVSEEFINDKPKVED